MVRKRASTFTVLLFCGLTMVGAAKRSSTTQSSKTIDTVSRKFDLLMKNSH
jgi:hypothetical protein